MKTLKLLFAIGLIGLQSHMSSLAFYQQFGSQTDLWDISNGTTVTAHSTLGTYPGGAYDPRDLFGGAFGSNIGLETGAIIFNDGAPLGFVHWIEWSTASAITMGSFNFHASEDLAPLQRAVARFRLLAKSANSATFDLVLFDHTPQQPYNWVDQSQYLLLSETISPVTAKDFRAEFYDLDGTPYGGPRVVELDAFAPVPEPTAGLLAVAGAALLFPSRLKKQSR
jgi:hypothetical protein